MKKLAMILILLFPMVASATDEKFVEYLQSITVLVTVGDDGSEGSGVLTNVNGVNYVITCGHVVIHAKAVDDKNNVTYNDIRILKDNKVYKAELVRLSNPKTGNDIAILKLADKITDNRVKFGDGKKELKAGTDFHHVGNFFGGAAINGYSKGYVIKSEFFLNSKRCNLTSPFTINGCSGSGVFLENKEYIGMAFAITNSGGFGIVNPISRMREWMTKQKLLWIMDEQEKVVSDEEMKKFAVDDGL